MLALVYSFACPRSFIAGVVGNSGLVFFFLSSMLHDIHFVGINACTSRDIDVKMNLLIKSLTDFYKDKYTCDLSSIKGYHSFSTDEQFIVEDIFWKFRYHP